MKDKTDYIIVYDPKDTIKILLDLDTFEVDDKNMIIKVFANEMRKNAYESMSGLISDMGENNVLDKKLTNTFKNYYEIINNIKAHDQFLFSKYYREFSIKYEDYVELLFEKYDEIVRINNLNKKEY